MTPATPVNPSPEAPSINIPISSVNPNSQLKALIMALVHSYGLTAVLEALSEGMFGHFDNTLEENDISTPILEALGTAHTVSKYVMKDQG
ncbi:hypothetical protein U2F10_24325 [Leptothoe sp. EHU-05/26/07-4]